MKRNIDRSLVFIDTLYDKRVTRTLSFSSKVNFVSGDPLLCQYFKDLLRQLLEGNFTYTDNSKDTTISDNNYEVVATIEAQESTFKNNTLLVLWTEEGTFSLVYSDIKGTEFNKNHTKEMVLAYNLILEKVQEEQGFIRSISSKNREDILKLLVLADMDFFVVLDNNLENPLEKEFYYYLVYFKYLLSKLDLEIYSKGFVESEFDKKGVLTLENNLLAVKTKEVRNINDLVNTQNTIVSCDEFVLEQP